MVHSLRPAHRIVNLLVLFSVFTLRHIWVWLRPSTWKVKRSLLLIFVLMALLVTDSWLLVSSSLACLNHFIHLLIFKCICWIVSLQEAVLRKVETNFWSDAWLNAPFTWERLVHHPWGVRATLLLHVFRIYPVHINVILAYLGLRHGWERSNVWLWIIM